MKKSLIAGALLLGLAGSSCLGPDNLYRSVKHWNAGLSDKDWINETVFIGMLIVPVYQIAMLGDLVIFNTVSYWSADSAIKDPGEFPPFHKKD